MEDISDFRIGVIYVSKDFLVRSCPLILRRLDNTGFYDGFIAKGLLF